MACRAHLGEVQKHYDAIRQLGGEVLVVSFTPPDKAAAYLARYPLPFPVVVDPSREAYRAFELGRTSWRALLSPKVIGGYLRQMLRGWLPHKPAGEEDLLQLGGDFVLDRQRRLVYAYRSSDPTDRPAAEALVQAVRQAVQSGEQEVATP